MTPQICAAFLRFRGSASPFGGLGVPSWTMHWMVPQPGSQALRLRVDLLTACAKVLRAPQFVVGLGQGGTVAAVIRWTLAVGNLQRKEAGVWWVRPRLWRAIRRWLRCVSHSSSLHSADMGSGEGHVG